MPIINHIQPITVSEQPVLPTPPPSATLEHPSGALSTSRLLALQTDEPYLDPILHKLSAYGQLDDIKAWAIDDESNYQVYALVTFRYSSDLHRVLRVAHSAQTKIFLGNALQVNHRPEIGVLQHHCCRDNIIAPGTIGTTRSVIFFDSHGNMVRLTPKFQNKVEKAWERVREKLYADSGPDQVGHSPIARAVPEPWRGNWWIIYPTFDLKRNRTTFENVDVARRVIKKMKKENWGGNWHVVEGRYVNDPIPIEELELEVIDLVML